MPSTAISAESDQRTWPTSASYIKFADAPEPWVWVPPPAPKPRLTVPDSRLRRLSVLIRNLGDRPLFELFKELVAGADPVARIEAYAALDPDILEALGADRLPPPRVVS